VEAEALEVGRTIVDFGVGDPREETPVIVRDALVDAIGPISSYPRAAGLPPLRRAIAAGARPVLGGGPNTELGHLYYQPTILDQVQRGMSVVTDEAFGPVVTVETFRTEDEAVATANDTIYGLAGAVWTQDAGKAQRVASRLRHGTIWINDYHPYLPQAEWGGFGQSGVGRELGPTGLAEYQEAKHIYQNTSPQVTGWFADHGKEN